MESADGKNYLTDVANTEQLLRLVQSIPSPKADGVSGETSVTGSEKSSEKILRHLLAEPTLSAKALAEKLGISSRAIEKQIDLLKKEGRLHRIGPAKGGHWEVIQ